MDGLQWVAEIAFRHLWQSFLIFALISVLFVRKNDWSAEHRSWTWSIAMVLMAALPVLTLLPAPSMNAIAHIIGGNNTHTIAQTVPPLTNSLSIAYSYNPELISPVTKTLDQTPWGRSFVLASIIGTWGLIALWHAVNISTAWARTASLRKEAKPLQYDRAGASDDWPANVNIALSDSIDGPMVVGLLRPYILLPTSLIDTLSEEQLHHVLAHELAHIKRGDLACNFVQRLLLAVFWWSPFMHIASRQIRTEREMACDDRAVRTAGSSKNYATSLMESAEALAISARKTNKLLAIGILEKRQSNFFAKRIRRLINHDYRGELELSHSHWAGISAVLVAAVMIFILSPRTAFSANYSITEDGCCDDIVKAVYDASPLSEFHLTADKKDPACKNDKSLTPLIAASEIGEYAAHQWMERQGGVITSRDALGPSALTRAVLNDDLARVKELLTAGENLNSYQPGGEPALLTAVKTGNTGLVKYLLSAGADPNVAVPWSGTALIAAVKAGHTDISKILLKHGADADIIVPGESLPILLATEQSDTAMVYYLLKSGADANLHAPGDPTALIKAAAQNEVMITKKLLAHGADPSVVSPEYGTALITAAKRDHYDIVKYLVKYGADISTTVWTGVSRTSATEIAKHHGNDQIADFLHQRLKSDRS